VRAFARLAKVPAASTMPLLLVEVEPIFAPAARNCAMDHAVAAVVTSSMVKVGDPAIELQRPRTPANTVPALTVPVEPA